MAPHNRYINPSGFKWREVYQLSTQMPHLAYYSANKGKIVTSSIKTTKDIQGMRIACNLAADCLVMIGKYVKPGITTGELDRICHDYIVNELNAVPAPLNYRGFPKSICTSINHVVCHGIPDDAKQLKKGDILNIDVTVIKDGYHGDTSKMFTVSETKPFADRLIRVTQECMYRGIELVRPGARLGDIGHAIQAHAESSGYAVVEEFCGHGIGKVFHEDPQVLHYGQPNTGVVLNEGMTFTIEPMINQGKKFTRILSDGWTAVTKDRKLSAQWEHTILVTKTGYDILTYRETDETFPKVT